MKTYIRKPPTIEAIQFIYDGPGILNLTKFCGDKLENYGKNRGLNQLAWAILSDGAIVKEGGYIVKENNVLTSYPKDVFLGLFEETKWQH